MPVHHLFLALAAALPWFSPAAAEPRWGGARDALVVIDVQRCFLPGGSLAVTGGDQVVPVINRLAPRFENVVITQDWHPPGHVSFASSHPGRQVHQQVPMPYGPQTLWPDHCVQGTAEAELTPDLKLAHARLIVRKGLRRDTDSYSALLEADSRTPTGLHGWLANMGIRRLVLVGLATDYCVLATALDARCLGYAVAVVEEATRGINVNGSLARAWDQMQRACVERLSVEALDAPPR